MEHNETPQITGTSVRYYRRIRTNQLSLRKQRSEGLRNNLILCDQERYKDYKELNIT
jgi:hypothetical protein